MIKSCGTKSHAPGSWCSSSGECCSVDVSTSGTVVGPIQTVEDDGPGRDVAAHLMTPVIEAALAAYRVRTTGEELS